MLSASKESCKPLSRLCAKVLNPHFNILKSSFSSAGAFSEKYILERAFSHKNNVSPSTVNRSSPSCNRWFSSTAVVSKKKDDLKSGITVTRDGSTIVCWHPEEPFPYEFSKPLPEEQSPEVNSILKIQSKEEVMSVFKDKPQDFITQELCKITFTSKHRWAPRQRDKRARHIPPDREWL